MWISEGTYLWLVSMIVQSSLSCLPKRDQPWDFFGRNDAKAETPVLCPPDAKTDSLKKTLMLGGNAGRRRRGRQRMRCLDNIIDLQIEPEAYTPILISFKGEYLYVWRDLDEEDNEYDLSFNYRPQWDGEAVEVKDAEIQCTLFKLSEEMYRYLFAQFDSYSNPFLGAGMSSPAFTYSNVRNGAGYLCGYSVVHSEWIKDNLFEE